VEGLAGWPEEGVMVVEWPREEVKDSEMTQQNYTTTQWIDHLMHIPRTTVPTIMKKRHCIPLTVTGNKYKCCWK
jgi:hypothetical protein